MSETLDPAGGIEPGDADGAAARTGSSAPAGAAAGESGAGAAKGAHGAPSPAPDPGKIPRGRTQAGSLAGYQPVAGGVTGRVAKKAYAGEQEPLAGSEDLGWRVLSIVLTLGLLGLTAVVLYSCARAAIALFSTV